MQSAIRSRIGPTIGVLSDEGFNERAGNLLLRMTLPPDNSSRHRRTLAHEIPSITRAAASRAAALAHSRFHTLLNDHRIENGFDSLLIVIRKGLDGGELLD